MITNIQSCFHNNIRNSTRFGAEEITGGIFLFYATKSTIFQ